MSVLAAGLPDLVADFPLNFQKQELRIETGDLVVRTRQDQMRSQMPLVLWRVTSAGIQLRATSPITVRVRSEGEFVFAENETLRIFAHGRTPEQALEQFEDHVVHFYESYANLGSDEVVGEGARLKQVFADSFQRG
jgi:hypothetical protein